MNKRGKTGKSQTGKIILFYKYLQILPVQKYLLFLFFSVFFNSLYMATESSVAY